MSSRHGDGKWGLRFEQPDKWRTGSSQSRDTFRSAESECHWLRETGAAYIVRRSRYVRTCSMKWRLAMWGDRFSYFRFRNRTQINAWFIRLRTYCNEIQCCRYKLDSQYKQLAYSSVARYQGILCIRTLRGRSLRYPSFVAVVHHNFTDIVYRSNVAYVSVATQFLYSRLIVEITVKPKFSAHINVHVVSPHLNPRF